jgi:hypothetical protein
VILGNGGNEIFGSTAEPAAREGLAKWPLSARSLVQGRRGSSFDRYRRQQSVLIRHANDPGIWYWPASTLVA